MEIMLAITPFHLFWFTFDKPNCLKIQKVKGLQLGPEEIMYTKL